MRVTRIKLWLFRIELDDGRVFTVNRRGAVWCFGPEGKATTCQEKTLWDSMRGEMLTPHRAEAIDKIIEELVNDGQELALRMRKVRGG